MNPAANPPWKKWKTEGELNIETRTCPGCRRSFECQPGYDGEYCLSCLQNRMGLLNITSPSDNVPEQKVAPKNSGINEMIQDRQQAILGGGVTSGPGKSAGPR